MDSSFLRKFEKREKDKAAEKAAKDHPETPEPVDERPTIPEIQKDKDLSRQFGGFLSAHRDDEVRQLGARMLTGELQEEDVAALGVYREKFFERKVQSEKLSQELVGERFDEILERSAPLKNLCKTYGKENIQELLKTGALEFAFSDNEAFDDLSSVVTKIENFEKRVEQPLQKEMSEFCKKFKLSEDEMFKAMDSDDPAKRSAQLQSKVREKMTGGSLLGIIGWGETGKDIRASRRGDAESSFSKSLRLANTKDAWKDSIEMRHEILEKQGSFIASFASSNPELRRALGRVINGERPLFKEGVEAAASFEDAKKMVPNEKNMKPLIDEYRSKLPRGTNLATETPDQIDARMGNIFNMAQRRAEGENKRKGGFWVAAIISFLFGASGSERDKFINNPSMRSMLAGA